MLIKLGTFAVISSCFQCYSRGKGKFCKKYHQHILLIDFIVLQGIRSTVFWKGQKCPTSIRLYLNPTPKARTQLWGLFCGVSF